ncbi:neutral zinc metallopeptidase [Sphingomonas sp. HITSZ_GF]|uniref:KPN_02809 family neutral zinc metallopeptidase n=1 Tax=Sphingomonas sp. HITSZ_GF TaxID=3037247 RepID=UPI00240E3D94|nr:neutral zinc metallopeptidase [Sphingomonas sp. HITSZ_GF]MDG2535333.1 neutral zinc metallopeptidase [Sphingomonas sp. HITSZ_GF]
MRLDDIDPTDNAQDLGSGGGGGGGGFGLLGLLPLLLGRGMGCGSIAIIGLIAIAYFAMSGGGGGLLGGAGGGGTGQSTTAGQSGRQVCTGDRLEACRVMRSADDTWAAIFRAEGKQYQPATIKFYAGSVQSGCGAASSAVGPFYCPADQGVYLDTSFFQELAQRFGAKGDFARDYVIAHEMGHHIQDLLGVSTEVSRRQARASQAEGNALSVRLELQADCYAGVWAAKNKDRIEPGDIEEGMTAANAIGDDTLQRQAQGTVVPESFTHGTSAQRMAWLRKGLESGDPAVCDTFSGGI